MLVIIESKFTTGAWVVIILIPIFLALFLKIRHHYLQVDRELAVNVADANFYLHKAAYLKPKVILPVSKIHRGTLAAIKFARHTSSDVTAVAVDIDPEKTRALQVIWQQLDVNIPLVILESPYRSVLAPLRKYIYDQDHRDPEQGLCMVVVPKAITTRWWHHLLHNHRAIMLRAVLYYTHRNRGSTRIFVDVPYQLKY